VICGGAALTRTYVEEDLANVYQGSVYYGQDAFSGLHVMNNLAAAGGKPVGAGLPPAPTSKKIPPPQKKYEVPKRSAVSDKNPVPKPQFLGYKILKNIKLEKIFPYINKTALFKGQW